MIYSALATLLLASTAAAQSTAAADIYGTWSSGSKSVSTGAGFADPENGTFTYPANTGISYSFSEDGFYEVARYRFKANGTAPNCITGIVNFHHGTYEILANLSIVLTPFEDGFQQIQDPCAAVSNFVEVYNNTELIDHYLVFTDPTDGLKLHLFDFDGSPMAPMFQLSTTPNMLPTRALRNDTTKASSSKRSLVGRSSNGAERSWETVTVVFAASVAAGIASLLL